VGDITAAHCNLPGAWRQGRDQAANFLQQTHIPLPSYDFKSLFAQHSGIDLLCVFGGGKYPSIHDTNNEEDHSILTLIQQDKSAIEDSGVTAKTAVEAQPEVDEPALTFEEVINDTFDPMRPKDLAATNSSDDDLDVDNEGEESWVGLY
jgi:hypothetical protein